MTVLAACAWRGPEADADGTRPGADAACPASAGAVAGADAEARTETNEPTAPQAPASHALLLLTWNVDWFQHPTEGPVDDAAQYQAVHTVLGSSGASLIALQELASETAFDQLRADMPGYGGVLSGYDWVQRTGLLWSRDDFELLAARPVSGLDDAGRPPLEVTLRGRSDDATWLVVVIHAKAQADAESHATRSRFATGLAEHLAAAPARTHVVVLGDFNDALDGSITPDAATPYAVFGTPSGPYATPTRALNQNRTGEASYSWGTSIDHIVLDARLGAHVVADSLDVQRDEWLGRYPDFTRTVSDHFPVVLAVDP